VLLVRERGAFTAIDPDCTEPSPMPVDDWIAASFHPLVPADAHFAPEFRLVEADAYRREFRSDRSHMRVGTAWTHPPPPWPCIGEGTNLAKFADTRADFIGEVVDLEGLRARTRPVSP
jgi:hypothetical protein